MKGKIEDFPFQCGAMIVGDFRTRGDEYIDYRELDALIEENPEHLFATTSSQQQASTSASLKAAGFKKVLTFKNTNTDNLITLWVHGPVTRIPDPITKARTRAKNRNLKKQKK